MTTILNQGHGYTTIIANGKSCIRIIITVKREGLFNQAPVASVASQCLLHCGDQGMSTQVQPNLILLVAIR